MKVLGLLVSLFFLVSCAQTANHHKQGHHGYTGAGTGVGTGPVTGTRIPANYEIWKDKELKLVIRDDLGRFKGLGTITYKSWNDGDETSEWTARTNDGQFTTGYKGRLEKWALGKGADRKETPVLVFRTTQGKLVTWASLEDHISEGWERWDVPNGKGRIAVYVVRFKTGSQKGQLVDWSRGKLEKWSNYDQRVLVAGDTADGPENGKLMSWIPAKQIKGEGTASVSDDQYRYVSPQDNKWLPTKALQ